MDLDSSTEHQRQDSELLLAQYQLSNTFINHTCYIIPRTSIPALFPSRSIRHRSKGMEEVVNEGRQSGADYLDIILESIHLKVTTSGANIALLEDGESLPPSMVFSTSPIIIFLL